MRAQDLHLDLPGATQFLSDLVSLDFLNILHSLGDLRETYCKKGEAQKERHAIGDLFRIFSH